MKHNCGKVLLIVRKYYNEVRFTRSRTEYEMVVSLV